MHYGLIVALSWPYYYISIHDPKHKFTQLIKKM